MQKKIKLLLQKKQGENIFDIISEEIVAIADKLLEYKCIFTKKQRFLLPKCSN